MISSCVSRFGAAEPGDCTHAIPVDQRCAGLVMFLTSLRCKFNSAGDSYSTSNLPFDYVALSEEQERRPQECHNMLSLSDNVLI